MRTRSSLSLLLATSLLLASSPPAAAQGGWGGGLGQEGPRLPEPGMPEISLGGRFVPLHVPAGNPDLGLSVGAWAGAGFGLRYSGAGAYPGNPHELEFSLKQRLLSEERGAPVTLSLLGAVNTGAYSLDGELALSRHVGPLTMFGTARLLGNAEGARLPLGGLGAGARLAVLPEVALLGDVFQVVNDPAALPAWGAGVQFHLPSTPYALTLHLANTPSATRQGASLGTSDWRFGVDLDMVFRGRQSEGRQAKPPSASRAAVAPGQASAPARSQPASQVARSARVRAVPAEPARTESRPAVTAHAAPATKESGRTSRSAVKGQASSKATAKPAPSASPRRESELWIVTIRDGRPTPAQVRLSRGSSVTWFNRDATAHVLVGPGWSSGRLEAGKQVTRRFEKAGTFRYHCRLHPNEAGIITVR